MPTISHKQSGPIFYSLPSFFPSTHTPPQIAYSPANSSSILIPYHCLRRPLFSEHHWHVTIEFHVNYIIPANSRLQYFFDANCAIIIYPFPPTKWPYFLFLTIFLSEHSHSTNSLQSSKYPRYFCRRPCFPSENIHASSSFSHTNNYQSQSHSLQSHLGTPHKPIRHPPSSMTISFSHCSSSPLFLSLPFIRQRSLEIQ